MYKSDSPWSKTSIINNQVLDIMNKRFIMPDPLDEIHTISAAHNQRPDLLSYAKYGTAKYWWVFAARNPNEIKDPIFDFVEGTVIRIPTKANIEKMV